MTRPVTSQTPAVAQTPGTTLAPVTTLGWWRAGESHFAAAVDALPDVAFSGPSLLPGWERGTLIAHVARNADALVNLVTWARTGVETPMYASADAREDGIRQAAAWPAPQLRTELRAASARLTDALDTLPGHAWTQHVRTAQGRTVPVGAVAWMRCREVWIHAADLLADASFADIPNDVAAALIDDVMQIWTGRDAAPDMTVVARDGGGQQRRWGSGTLAVSGSLAEAAAWLTGRSDGAGLTADGPLPTLPRWL